MNTMETICSRKTVRSFNGENISARELDTIITAANASPVGMGAFESMHLTVITNKDLLAEIDKAGAIMFNKPEIHPLYGAPTLIMISSKAPANGMENVVFSNAAIMSHNIALAATELGVGACYIWGATMAVSKNEKILKELNLPEGFVPCCAVALGKTDSKYDMREIPENKISKNFID